MKRLLFIFLFFLSNNAIGQCPLVEDRADRIHNVYNLIQNVNEFEAQYESGFKNSGSAESTFILSNYLALTYKPSSSESGVFIIAFDNSNWDFYIYHGMRVMEPTRFHRGTNNFESCKVEFYVSEREYLDIDFPGEGKVVFTVFFKSMDSEKFVPYATFNFSNR